MPSCPTEEVIQGMKMFVEAFPVLGSDLDGLAMAQRDGLNRDDLEKRVVRGDPSESTWVVSFWRSDLTRQIVHLPSQPINTFILSSIAHGVLKRKSALNEDGSLPGTGQNVKLFDEGREDAAAAHTCTHSDLPEPLQGKKAYRDEIQTLMKQIRQRRTAKKGPKSFKQCLQLVQPGHPLLATSQVSPQPDHAIGIQGTRTDAKDSTRSPPLKLQDTTRPSSLDAGVSKEGCESQWSVRTKVTLVGHRKYISTAQKKVDGDEEADEWVLMADGLVVSNPCAGGEGCDCPVRHVGIECVCVCDGCSKWCDPRVDPGT
jgi:hypothetical protein